MWPPMMPVPKKPIDSRRAAALSAGIAGPSSMTITHDDGLRSARGAPPPPTRGSAPGTGLDVVFASERQTLPDCHTDSGRWTRVEDSCVVGARIGWCAVSRGGEAWRGLLVI